MNFLRQIISHFTGDDVEVPQSDIRIVDGKIISSDQFTPPKENIHPSKLKKRRTSQSQEILTLSELLKHKNLKKGYVPIGLRKKDKILIQSTWKKMTTGVIAGRRNHGKSSILKAMILLALYARKKGLKCQIHFFDPLETPPALN